MLLNLFVSPFSATIEYLSTEQGAGTGSWWIQINRNHATGKIFFSASLASGKWHISTYFNGSRRYIYIYISKFEEKP